MMNWRKNTTMWESSDCLANKPTKHRWYGGEWHPAEPVWKCNEHLEISWAENHQIYDAWKILSSKPPGKHGRQHTHTIQYISVNLCATQRRKGVRLEELDVLEAVSWYNVQPHASPKCSIGIGWTFPVISWNSGSPLSQETCDNHFLY